MPKLVIWDFNGCLVNDGASFYKHGPCAIFPRYGLPVPPAEDYYRNITSDFVRYYHDRGVPSCGDRIRDAETLNAIMKEGMSAAPVPPLFPEAEDVLASLREESAAQVLVSALEEREFRRQLGHHGLEKRFHETRGGVRGKAPVFRKLIEAYRAHGRAFGITDTLGDARELAEAGARPIVVPREYAVTDIGDIPGLQVAADLREALALTRAAAPASMH